LDDLERINGRFRITIVYFPKWRFSASLRTQKFVANDNYIMATDTINNQQEVDW